MYIGEYTHEQSYFQFEVCGELPDEGILKGKEGEFEFKRVQDGYAIYNSSLLNSGFLWPGSRDDVYVPHTINNIPVTELHQTISQQFPECAISQQSKWAFSIEHGNLQRLYIKLKKKSLDQQLKDFDNFDNKLLGALLLYAAIEKGENQENNFTELKFDFCGSQIREIEYCSITCDDKLVLHIPNTKTLDVYSSKTEIRGSVPDCVEKMSFTGKVYPFMEPGFDFDEPNNRCFKGKKKLKFIEGSLSGVNGWSFQNCIKLEKVHLSNGIEQILEYAFSGCESLIDLYIPDTVKEIGDFCFSGCTNLCSIHLPSKLTKISRGSFNGCKSLKKVYLADTIEVIEEMAFEGCSSLKKPWIPKNIKYIAENAFPHSEW